MYTYKYMHKGKFHSTSAAMHTGNYFLHRKLLSTQEIIIEEPVHSTSAAMHVHMGNYYLQRAIMIIHLDDLSLVSPCSMHIGNYYLHVHIGNYYLHLDDLSLVSPCSMHQATQPLLPTRCVHMGNYYF